MSLAFLFKWFKVTVSRNYFAVLLENFAENFCPTSFLCRCAECRKDNMVSCPMDEDPRLDSPPKCEAFLVDVHVMPLGELYRFY